MPFNPAHKFPSNTTVPECSSFNTITERGSREQRQFSHWHSRKRVLLLHWKEMDGEKPRSSLEPLSTAASTIPCFKSSSLPKEGKNPDQNQE